MEVLILFIVILFVLVVLSKAFKRETQQDRYKKIKAEKEAKSEINIRPIHIPVTPNRKNKFLEKQVAVAGDRSKLSGCYDVAIKGLYYRDNSAQQRACSIQIGEELFLRKDEYNSSDPYAIGVYTNDNYHIGYLDRSLSKTISTYIDNKFEICCFLRKSTGISIPYQYMDLYYLGDNPNYDPFEIEYKKESKRIRDIMKRANDTINTTQKEHVKQKAIEKLEQNRMALLELEKKHELHKKK